MKFVWVLKFFHELEQPRVVDVFSSKEAALEYCQKDFDDENRLEFVEAGVQRYMASVYSYGRYVVQKYEVKI